jgi:hypothetical protein
MDEDLQHEVEQLKLHIELLNERVAKNSEDCQQLWMFVRVYFAGAIGKIGKIKLNKKTVTTLIISLTLGLTNFFLQFFEVV